MEYNAHSIAKEFYAIPEKLYDRKALTKESGIDVIIPVINTNEFFERNLYNFYERIPINRLLIGDGGCTDETIVVVSKFPRSEVIQQSNLLTLGACLKDLIARVETEHFLYLHADVFLPENWYDTMMQNSGEYDWFDCSIRNIMILEVSGDSDKKNRGTLPGTHVGRTSVLREATEEIDDDYVYRNEDFIIKEGVIKQGGRYGSVFDTIHYHQITNKDGEKEPKIESVIINKQSERRYELKTAKMQAMGNIKYLPPNSRYVKNTYGAISTIKRYNALDWHELRVVAKENNRPWLKFLNRIGLGVYHILRKFRDFIQQS